MLPNSILCHPQEIYESLHFAGKVIITENVVPKVHMLFDHIRWEVILHDINIFDQSEFPRSARWLCRTQLYMYT